MSALSEIVTRSYRRYVRALAKNLDGVEVPAERLGSLVALADTFPAGDVVVSVELMAFRPDVWPQFADWTARQVIGKPQPLFPSDGPLDLRVVGTRNEIEFAVARLRERTAQVVVGRAKKIEGPPIAPRFAVTVTVVEW